MRIDLRRLQESMTVDVEGGEDWLQPIYESFSHPEVDSSQRIRGTVTIELLPDTDFVRVHGSVSYAPKVDCSRCAMAIDWPLTAEVDEYLQRDEDPSLKQKVVEATLTEAPPAFVEDDHLNLESLINDALQLAMPNQLVPRSEDGSSCLVCDRDLSKAVVVTQEPESKGEEVKESPFQVLAGMKWEK